MYAQTSIFISHLVVHHQREKRKTVPSEEENAENSPTMKEQERAALSLQQLHKER